MSPRDIGEALGVLAVVASVLFLAIQVRQAREIALSETDASVLESTIQMLALLAEHASIWEQGAAGEPLSPADSVVFRSLVQAQNDVAYFNYERAAGLGSSSDIIPRMDFATVLFRNPGARAEWLAREDELIDVRRRVAPDLPDFSFWRDGILSDLASLDSSTP